MKLTTIDQRPNVATAGGNQLTHTDLINKIIKEKGYKRYLELGVFNRSHNFDLINCQWKFCVDPDPEAKANFVGSSDEFFESNYQMFDCCWIDGMHTAEQVKRDFDNCLRFLSEDGIICMHDVNPPEKITTCVPRGNQREWCGSVFEFACQLNTYDGIDFYTWPQDYGCTVVWKDITKKGTPMEPVSWEVFDRNRAELLRFKNDAI